MVHTVFAYASNPDYDVALIPSAEAMSRLAVADAALFGSNDSMALRSAAGVPVRYVR